MYTIASKPGVHSSHRLRRSALRFRSHSHGWRRYRNPRWLAQPGTKNQNTKGATVSSGLVPLWRRIARRRRRTVRATRPGRCRASLLSVGSELRSPGRTLTERNVLSISLYCKPSVACPLRSVWLAGCNHIPQAGRFFCRHLDCRKAVSARCEVAPWRARMKVMRGPADEGDYRVRVTPTSGTARLYLLRARGSLGLWLWSGEYLRAGRRGVHR